MQKNNLCYIFEVFTVHVSLISSATTFYCYSFMLIDYTQRLIDKVFHVFIKFNILKDRNSSETTDLIVKFWSVHV